MYDSLVSFRLKAHGKLIYEVNHLNKFKRKLHKDRYGIVRGSVALCLLIAFCLGLFISVQLNNNISAEKNHAALAAQQVTASFETMIDEAVRSLQSYSAMLSDAKVSSEAVLDAVLDYGNFCDAEVLTSESADSNDDIRIRQDGDRLRLSCGLQNGQRLVAWIHADAVSEILTNAFPEDYGFLVYNAQNGSFFINNTDFDAAGYYDVLLNLNENGDLEALLESSDGEALVQQNLFQLEGGYYIAQQSTNVSPWSIALVIPEKLLHNEAWNGRQMLFFAVAAEVLIMLFLIGHTLFVLHRIQCANRNTARALSVSEHMTNVIASDAQITTFIYHRNDDRILCWYDGIDLLQGDTSHDAGISSLAKYCKLADGETEHIYDALADLRQKDYAEVQLHGFSDVHDERLWQLSMHALNDNMGIVLCSIQDCTRLLLAQDRMEQEQLFRAGIQKKASSIWTINVSRNRWSVEYYKRDWLPRALNMADDGWNDYSADLNGGLHDFLHPTDLDSYMDNMSLSNLMDAFRSGCNELVQDYRIRCGNNRTFEWHRMQIRIWQDAKTGDVIASLYVFNVDAKKNAELERGERKKMLQQTLTALGGIYQGLYYVDIDNDLAYTARSMGGDVVDRLCMPYKSWIEQYIAESVHPQNQEELRQLLDTYMIRKTLTEGTHLQLRRYKRRINGDVYADAEIIIQPARFENGTVKEIVIAIRYMNN